MTRQTDPAGETPSTASGASGTSRAHGPSDGPGSAGVTIRRAVPLQGTAQDPGTALTPGAGRPDQASAELTAPLPPPAPGASAASAVSSEPAPSEGAPTGPVRTGNEEEDAGEGAEGASAAGEEQAAAGSTVTKSAPGLAPAESGAVTSAPDTAASEPDADTVVVAGGSGGAGPTAAGQAHTGPKKPMLAAAAIVGAILIGVPFLVAGQGDREEGGSDRTDNAAGTVLDTDRNPHASESYGTESPSPSASTSSSPSNSPEEKQARDEKAAPVVQEQKASPTASQSAKPKQGKATTTSSAEKLRQKANAASSAGNILLKNATTGLCADVPNYGNGKIDGPVNQYPCDGTTADNQLWNLEVAQAKGGPQGPLCSSSGTARTSSAWTCPTTVRRPRAPTSPSTTAGRVRTTSCGGSTPARTARTGSAVTPATTSAWDSKGRLRRQRRASGDRRMRDRGPLAPLTRAKAAIRPDTDARPRTDSPQRTPTTDRRRPE